MRSCKLSVVDFSRCRLVADWINRTHHVLGEKKTHSGYRGLETNTLLCIDIKGVTYCGFFGKVHYPRSV